MNIITEAQFVDDIVPKLRQFCGIIASVSGPGRSGAIAGVYASYFLGVPYISNTDIIRNTPHLHPHLVVDTAIQTGSTLRKHASHTGAEYSLAFYSEPPRQHFFFEAPFLASTTEDETADDKQLESLAIAEQSDSILTWNVEA